MSRLIIAVDGPSGSGKSSTARGVARRLGIAYLDTGAMYRATTWALLQRGVDVSDADVVAKAADSVRIESGTDPDAPEITADGTDVAGQIRGGDVTAAVSAVSAVPRVRERLVAMQRAIVERTSDGIVVEGRDIGSVVLPNAPLKVYLVADTGARAARRTAELGGGHEVTATERDLARRDRLDSSREASPLVQADDAVTLDTTDLSLDEVVDRVVKLAEQVS